MSEILKPAACSARSADSRPEPGPFTNTGMVRMPWSIAFLAASSAASCAANGVDLREPLKPRTPAEDHDTTLPETSVMVTMVLLNVDWMWQMPLWTFFLTFFFATLAMIQILDYAGPAGLAPAGAGPTRRS